MQVFYTGSFSPKGENGIKAFRLSDNGEIDEIYANSEIDNPSYVVVSPCGKYLYTNSEGPEKGALNAFKINNDASLSYLNSMPSSGGWTCHLACSQDGKYLASAGFESGDVDLYTLDVNGTILAHIFHDRHTGVGTHPERQEGPHAHCVSFCPWDECLLYVTDLGLDKIYCYKIDQDKVNVLYTIDIPAGDGPRHIAWHPTKHIMYVVCEITYRLHAISLEGSKATIIDTAPCMPFGFDDFGGSAAIRVVGGKLYITNRIMCEPWHRDCAVTYNLDESGKPTECARIGTAYIPRDMNICGDYMLVGCQGDNMLQVISLDENKNTLQIINERQVNQICCVSDLITL